MPRGAFHRRHDGRAAQQVDGGDPHRHPMRKHTVQGHLDGCPRTERQGANRKDTPDGRRPPHRETRVLWLSAACGIQPHRPRQTALCHRLSHDGMGLGTSATDAGEMTNTTYQQVSNDGASGKRL